MELAHTRSGYAQVMTPIAQVGIDTCELGAGLWATRTPEQIIADIQKMYDSFPKDMKGQASRPMMIEVEKQWYDLERSKRFNARKMLAGLLGREGIGFA